MKTPEMLIGEWFDKGKISAVEMREIDGLIRLSRREGYEKAVEDAAREVVENKGICMMRSDLATAIRQLKYTVKTLTVGK